MEYRPLDISRNEIRLITLLPAEDDSPDEIRCLIEHYYLDDYTSEYRDFTSRFPQDKTWAELFVAWRTFCLQKVSLPDDCTIPEGRRHPQVDILFRHTWGDYAAMSYAWGDDTKQRSIVLNGQQFHVTDNLHAALEAYRAFGQSGRTVKLWVDAICINQNDIEERSAQIQRMRRIYGLALRAFAWLGPEGDDSDAAIDMLEMMQAAIETAGFLQTDQNYSSDFSANYQELMDSFQPYQWRALFYLFDRPYWKRLWILQGISASHSTTSLRCGRNVLGMYTLCRAFEVLALDTDRVLASVSNALKEIDLDLNPSPAFVRVSRIQCLCRGLLGTRLLNEGLELARFSQQSNQKDKVYGIMGLLDGNITKNITPDYALSTSEVYIDLAKAVVNGTQTLEILLHKEMASQGQLSLPTWVPDWTANFAQMRLTLYGSCSASGTSLTPYQVSDSKALLPCRGILGDAINGLAATDITKPIVQATTRANAYKSTVDVEHALWMNLMTGNDYECERDPSIAHMRLATLSWDLKPDFRQLQASSSYQTFHSYRLSNKSFEIFGRELSDFFPDGPQSPYLQPGDSSEFGLFKHHFQKAVARISGNLNGRTLMITENGHLGLAPSSAARGDIVAVLLGCRSPMVLRPCGSLYQVVGACYIHDMMGGEMMEELDAGRFQLEDITLC